MKKSTLALLAALSVVSFNASAAIDAAVITTIKGVVVDVDSLGGAVFTVVVAVFAWKMLRKAL